MPNKLSKKPAQRTSRDAVLVLAPREKHKRAVATTLLFATCRRTWRRLERSAVTRGAMPTAPTTPRLAIAIACLPPITRVR